jgi:hypothetical protein
LATHPHQQVASVIQQEDAVRLEPLVGEVDDGWKADPILAGSQNVLVLRRRDASLSKRSRTKQVKGTERAEPLQQRKGTYIVGHVVDGEHARVDERDDFVGGHRVNDGQVERSLVHTHVSTTPECRVLLERHLTSERNKERTR